MNNPVMVSAEEAISLFDADKSEQPVDFTSDFDVVYQKVKVSLFSSDVTERNEKELINALAKVKLDENQCCLKTICRYLAQVIKADGVIGI